MCIHSFISVTVDNSIFELSLMISIIVLSALLVVTCVIAVSSVCIVIIVKCKKEKGKQSVRRKPPWRKNAMKRGIATDSIQPEPPVYIEILPDLRAPRSSGRKSGSSGSRSQTLPMSVPVRCTNPSNIDKTYRVHSLEDNTYVNVGVHRTATQTRVSKV